MELGLGNLLYSVSIFLCVGVASGIQPTAYQPNDEHNGWIEQLDGSSYSDSSSLPYFSSIDDGIYDVDSDSTVDAGWLESNEGPSLDDTATDRGGTHGFHQLDKNHDGFVTIHEYNYSNPDADTEMTKTLFSLLDTDGDKQLSKAELDFGETTEECEVFAMQRCVGQLTYTVEVNEEVTDQEAMCRGLQSYLDCFSSESLFCNFTDEFLQAIYTIADAYKTTKLCEHIVIGRLAMFADSNTSSRRKRSISITTGDGSSPTDGTNLDCANHQLARCSSLFNRSLRKAGDICATLGEYRHCVSHAAKSCHDETLLHLKESVGILAHVHKQFHVCDFH